MKISEICQKDVQTISKNQTIIEALGKMGSRLTKLPVTDGGRLIGIITIRDILEVVGSSKTQNPEHVHVSGAMKKDLKALPPDADIPTAVNTMLEHDISSIPIVEGESLVGILTKTDLLSACTEIGTPISGLVVEPTTVSLGHSIPHIREIMSNSNISMLPVTDGGRLIGIIRSRDITKKIMGFKKDIKKHQDAIKNMAVEDFYRQDTVSVTEEEAVGAVAKKLLEEKRTALPVTRNGDLVGIISKTDLLKALL